MTPQSAVRLGDVASFIRGITFKPDNVVPVGSEGSVACMRTKNVQSELDLGDVWGIPKSLVKRDDQYLAAGDVLVSSANSWNLVGKCCWVSALPWRATFGGFISVLRADRGSIDPRYLYHWFASPRIQATVRSFGQQTTNISNLNVDRCLRLPLSLPPLSDQRRIAAILDAADTLRSKRRAVLAKLDTLIQSVFLDMFGDPIKNPRGFPVQELAEVIDPQRPISYGILKPGPDQDHGVKYVRVVDMKDGGISLSGIRRTTEEISNAYRRSLLNQGDLLLSIRGHVGRLALVPPELTGANITQDTARLALKGTDAIFVRECLRTPSFQLWMSRHTKGVAVQGINLGDVKLMPIIQPPTNQQDTFRRIAEKLESIRLSHLASLARCETLFCSLRDRAFSGRL